MAESLDQTDITNTVDASDIRVELVDEKVLEGYEYTRINLIGQDRSLKRLFRLHQGIIEHMWKDLDEVNRRLCFEAVAAYTKDSVRRRRKVKMMNVFPEWTRQNIAESGPSYFINMLRYRASRSLWIQYMEQDHKFIEKMPLKPRARRILEDHTNGFLSFYDHESYGEHQKSNPAQRAQRSDFILPLRIGGHLLDRQTRIVSRIKYMSEYILSIYYEENHKGDKLDPGHYDVCGALSTLCASSTATKPTPSSLSMLAKDRGISNVERLELLVRGSDFTVERCEVRNVCHDQVCRGGLRKRGKCCCASDGYASIAYIDSVREELRGMAVWKIMEHLLEQLSSTPHAQFQAVLLQELANICAFEYAQAQTDFRRYVQVLSEDQYFTRLEGQFDKAGNTLMVMKANPLDLVDNDPHIYYILNLCRSRVQPAQAYELLQGLGRFYELNPKEASQMSGGEHAHGVEASSQASHARNAALLRLTIITSFIHDLSAICKLPYASRKKGRAFLGRMQGLDSELDVFAHSIDIIEHITPIVSMLDPERAQRMHDVLNEHAVEHCGSPLQHLYHDVVADTMEGLDKLYQEIKVAAESQHDDQAPWTFSFTEWMPMPKEDLIAARRIKEKTRPSQPAGFEPDPPQADEERGTDPEADGEQAAQKYKVNTSAAKTFLAILGKSSETRGAVPWSAFTSAMVELGFSVVPKMGSVYAFLPPENMKARRSMTIHRPHQSKIEGAMLVYFAARLRRVFGWDETSFEEI